MGDLLLTGGAVVLGTTLAFFAALYHAANVETQQRAAKRTVRLPARERTPRLMAQRVAVHRQARRVA